MRGGPPHDPPRRRRRRDRARLLLRDAARLGSAGEYVDYAASKGAIDTLGLGLAREVAAEGVRVNVVRPGFIDTEIHEPGRLERVVPAVAMGRSGRAEEVVAAILWLLGDTSE